MAPRPLAAIVADIAERVARLAPSHRDPEEFHIRKSDLAAELRRVARQMERAA
jgi:predicted ATP-binding protein involved in virulence